MTELERITLEKVDSQTFRLQVEGDVEGHQLPVAVTLLLEPVGEDESGTPLYRLTPADTQGHVTSDSDERLKRNIRPL